MTEIAHFIDNARVAGTSGRSQPVFNPATGEAEKTVALASTDEVNAAVASAKTAWATWSKTPPLRRARILDRFKMILWDRADQLAEAISAEHGKTHDDAVGEVTRGLEVVEFAVGAPHLLKGDYTEDVGTGVDSNSVRQSLGVVAGITPFNFPAMVPMWMFPVALACGNTFILKPSERDPSASLLIAEWLAEAGLPEGVFNVIQGDKEAVDALLTHPDVKAISFVGSTPIAKYIYETGTANGKRVQALGGAKNHMVILPDADLDMAANALMGAAYGSAGERCMAISVAVPVTDAVADALIERLVPKIEALKVGPAEDKASDMGPVVTKAAQEKILGLIDKGEAEGAKIVVDGREFTAPQGYENGYFVGPTLIDHVTPEMTVWREEIFGPVMSVLRFSDEQEVIDRANDTPYGLAAGVMTQDLRRAHRVIHQLQAGICWVNSYGASPAEMPVGGYKLSGIGRENGMETLKQYTQLKSVYMGMSKLECPF